MYHSPLSRFPSARPSTSAAIGVTAIETSVLVEPTDWITHLGLAYLAVSAIVAGVVLDACQTFGILDHQGFLLLLWGIVLLQLTSSALNLTRIAAVRRSAAVAGGISILAQYFVLTCALGVLEGVGNQSSASLWTFFKLFFVLCACALHTILFQAILERVQGAQ